MALLSAGTLAQLVGIAESAMLDTVTIYGPATRTVIPLDNGGYRVEQTAAPPVVTKGMIGPLSKGAIDRLIADNIEPTGLEQIEVPKGTAVTNEDQIEYLSLRHGTTRRYTVKALPELDTYAMSRSVIVKAV